MNNVFYVVWSDASAVGTYVLAHINPLWLLACPILCAALVAGFPPKRFPWRAMLELLIGCGLVVAMLYFVFKPFL